MLRCILILATLLLPHLARAQVSPRDALSRARAECEVDALRCHVEAFSDALQVRCPEPSMEGAPAMSACYATFAAAADQAAELASPTEASRLLALSCAAHHRFERLPEALQRCEAAIEASPRAVPASAVERVIEVLQRHRDEAALYEAVSRYHQSSELRGRSELRGTLDALEARLGFRRCASASPRAARAICYRDYADDHRRDPRAARALLRAGEDWRDAGDYVGAIGVWMRVVTHHAETAQAERALIALADLHHGIGVYSRAADFYERYLEAFTSGPDALRAVRTAIRLRVGLGQGQEAMSHYALLYDSASEERTRAAIATEVVTRLSPLGVVGLGRWMERVEATGGPAQIDAARAALAGLRIREGRLDAADALLEVPWRPPLSARAEAVQVILRRVELHAAELAVAGTADEARASLEEARALLEVLHRYGTTEAIASARVELGWMGLALARSFGVEAAEAEARRSLQVALEVEGLSIDVRDRARLGLALLDETPERGMWTPRPTWAVPEPEQAQGPGAERLKRLYTSLERARGAEERVAFFGQLRVAVESSRRLMAEVPERRALGYAGLVLAYQVAGADDIAALVCDASRGVLEGASDEDAAELLGVCGVTYVRRGAWREAERAWRRAVERGPSARSEAGLVWLALARSGGPVAAGQGGPREVGAAQAMKRALQARAVGERLAEREALEAVLDAEARSHRSDSPLAKSAAALLSW